MTCPFCGYRNPDLRDTCRRCGASLAAALEKSLGEDAPGESGPEPEEPPARRPADPGARPAWEAPGPEVVVELDDADIAPDPGRPGGADARDVGDSAAEALRRRALTAGDRDRPRASPWEAPPGIDDLPAGTERAAPPPRPAPPVAAWPGPVGAPLPAASRVQAAPPTMAWSAAAVPPVGRAYAGFWIRLLAMVVDATVLGLVAIFTAATAFLLAGGPGALLDPVAAGRQFPWLSPLISLFELLLAGLYSVYFTGATGATPGKAVLRLEVVRADGRPVGFGAAFVRFLGYGLELIPGFFGAGVVWGVLALFAALVLGRPGLGMALGGVASGLVFLGFVWAAFDPRKQAWHDKLAGTVVVRVG